MRGERQAGAPRLPLLAFVPSAKPTNGAAAAYSTTPFDISIEQTFLAKVWAMVNAYRARAPWLEGRLVVTPHAAWFTPQSEHDTRVKSAETMRAALLTNRPQNVITPEMF